MEKIKSSRTKIYDGTSKIIYLTSEEYYLVQFFKDEVFINSETHIISGKGVINNSISNFLMDKLNLVKIENHLIEKMNMREQKIQALDIVPIQTIVSNIAIDSYVSYYGIQEGLVFNVPMIDFRVKNSKKNFPRINESQIVDFNWATKTEIEEIKSLSRRINDFLTGFFAAKGLRLMEISLEFGRVYDGENFIMILADEITPETFKVSEMNSNERIDVEYFLKKKKDPIKAYKIISKKLGIG